MQRFDGEICGVGTTSGVRIVVGRWTSSPFGPFADAMVEDPGGRRTLIAPSAPVAELIGGLYAFDDTIVAETSSVRVPGSLHFAGGPLDLEVTVGGRDALGRLLRCVPHRLATSPVWATVVDPIARVTLRGVRTSGRTAGGRETYGATDRHHVTAAAGTWCGADLGGLADVDPPVRFGFSSAPKRPSLVTVSTTIRPHR